MNTSKTIPNFQNLAYRFVSIETKNKMQKKKKRIALSSKLWKWETLKNSPKFLVFSKNSLSMHIRQKCL